jgi:hypothetical protein
MNSVPLTLDSNILQYQISDWTQLSKCQSNNSPDLKISVSKYMQNWDIEGTKIEVKHPTYGVLFAYTILPKGELITDITKEPLEVMHKQTLLNELRRYGFYVDYQEEAHLPAGQVNLLRTIQGLKFDKIRLFSVADTSTEFYDTIRITAFNVFEHDAWLNPGYSPSKKEWEAAILDGTAFNISGLDEAMKYDWDWLYNGVYDLDAILLRYEYA